MNENHDQTPAKTLSAIRIPFSGWYLTVLVFVAIGGLVAAFANALLYDNAWQRFWMAYLVAFSFVLSISVGMLFFVLSQHLTRAGWSVVVRRIAEVFSMNLVVVAVFFLPIAWLVVQHDDAIYFWAKQNANGNLPGHAIKTIEKLHNRTTHGSTNHSTLQEISPVQYTPSNGEQENLKPGTTVKASAIETGHDISHVPQKPYLNNTRFLVAWAIYFSVWIGIATFYFLNSIRQDKNQSVENSRRMEWCSGISMVLFGFAVTYAAFDLLMSLDPVWYSTIFGVYFFSGSAVAGIAALLLTILILKRSGIAPGAFSEEVQRDLGRLLFAFVFFWAYIAFSQYMLLWYANVPETTAWLVRRGMSTATGYTNSWGWVAVGLLFAHFVIPFAAIMSRHVKSNSTAMMVWTIWLLAIHLMDLYWIIIPQTNPQFTISFVEIGTVAAVFSLYLLAAIFIASRNNLFPTGDPRLHESLHRHETY